MSTKSNAFPLLKNFIAYVETQFHVNVQCIRSDNGIEFQDTSALQFYAMSSHNLLDSHDPMSSHNPTLALPHNLPDSPYVTQSSNSSQPTAEVQPQNLSVSLPSSEPVLPPQKV